MDSPKNQISDRLKQANNILVTVSNSPSVDQLSAAIGITLLLNKLGKHATAVFSGDIPSTIEFLQPEKTLEKTTDSLRDFIIALDKARADKLRYKVEDQMVKIFITPYRTSITDKDLEFSQGDFNVEVVLALGVNEQKDLDQAITSHGRILHDATVISVNTKDGVSLGSLDLVQPDASSLCEILLDLGLTLKADVLDGQMATAFLTGIVAETNRFSNEKTSSETMQLSAKLMAAGANQQLVATQLQAVAPTDLSAAAFTATQVMAKNEDDAELPEITDGEHAAAPAEIAEVANTESKNGALQINHENPKPLIDLTADLENEEPAEQRLEQIHIDQDGIIKTADQIDSMKQKIVEPIPGVTTEAQDPSRLIMQPPALGGTLTANSVPEGLDPSIDPLGVSGTSPLLSHETPLASSPLNDLPPAGSAPIVDKIINANSSHMPNIAPDFSATPPEPAEPVKPQDTLAALEEVVHSQHIVQQQPNSEEETPLPVQSAVDHVDAARDAVMQAVSGTTPQVLEPVQSLNIQPMDLNLGDMPAVATSPASSFADAGGMVNPSIASPQTLNNDIGIAPDTGFPSGLVPPAPGLPADNTARQLSDPTAPPPVPPPMMPPSMPPTP